MASRWLTMTKVVLMLYQGSVDVPHTTVMQADNSHLDLTPRFSGARCISLSFTLRVFVSTPLTSLSLLLLYFHVGEIAFNTGNWYVKDTLYMSGMACVYSILLLSLIDARQHAVHHFTVRSFLGSSTMFDH